MAELKIWNGSAWVTIANADAVPNALFDAHTILKADSDNTPVALAVATNTLLGRQAGNINDIPIDNQALVGRQGTVITNIAVADNTLVGRSGGDVATISVATNEVVGRRAGNLEAFPVAAQSLVGRQGGQLDDILISASNIVGRTATGSVGALTAAEIADILAASLNPAFISGRWYNQSPGKDPDVVTTALVLATNTIWYYPLLIDQTVSLDALGTYVATAEAGTNARVAIYNSDSTPQPTTLVVESDDLTLAVADNVTDPVTETLLPPGRYWWAINADSATAATRRFNTPANNLHVLGSANPGAEAAAIYTEAHALGAFPATATPAGPTAANNVPLIKFQVV